MRLRKESGFGKWWKQFPLLITVPFVSRCCGAEMIVVESKTSGWVKADCPRCLSWETNRLISEPIVNSLKVPVDCPRCNSRMKPGKVWSGSQHNSRRITYGFECDYCHSYVWLSQIVPHYSDRESVRLLYSNDE